MTNPYKIVEMFEETIADYAGSKYAVAVESCTAAIFLCLMYKKYISKLPTEIDIPAKTYPGVACAIIHAGSKIKFVKRSWGGEYHLFPSNIWDAALRFKRGMYHGGFQCLSFHIKKLLPIGRGGMILTDDFQAVKWLRKARFDGRNPVPLQDDSFDMLGWNMYMSPDHAARGLQLFQVIENKELPDLSVESQKYPDLSKFKIYTQ